jgi:hypothetical protein
MSGVSQPIESPSTGSNRRGNQRPGTGRYYQRKVDGTCTRCGKEPATEDSLLGERCLARERRRVKRAVRRLRARRKKEKRCRGCDRKSETARCPACHIRADRIPSTGSNHTGNHPVAEPRGVWRDDANGWHRFRGRGRRGAPPAGANDEGDLRMILVAIQRGTEALAYARSAEVQAMGRITRQAAVNEAAALLGHAERGLEELRDRLRKGG